MAKKTLNLNFGLITAFLTNGTSYHLVHIECVNGSDYCTVFSLTAANYSTSMIYTGTFDISVFTKTQGVNT
jgi:hypothetical protein